MNPADLSPDLIRTLLQHFRWTQSGGRPGLYQVWTKDAIELIFPLDQERGDYDELLDKARSVLLRTDGSSVIELASLFNVQESARLEAALWRKESPLEAGLIAWEEGQLLYASARQQLAAAARATKEPKRYFGNSGYYVAKQFLAGVLMGQTQRGSYVITAYSPSGNKYFISQSSEQHEAATGELISNHAVSGAEIFGTFRQALSAVRAAIDLYRSSLRIEVFSEAISEGVSFEMTNALSDFTAGGESAVFVDRQPPDKGQPVARTEYAFSPVDSQILNSAAVHLAQTDEPVSVTLAGTVTLLSRSPGSRDEFIRLACHIQDADRKVRVRLTADQYELALKAHADQVPLEVRGTLVKDGRFYWLEGAEGVRLPSNSDPADLPRTLPFSAEFE